MRRNLVTGLCALLLGAGYLAMAMQLRTSALADAVGPAGVPRVLGVLMMAFGAILSVQALQAGRRAPKSAFAAAALTGGAAPEPDGDEAETVGLAGIAKAAGLLAIAIAYLLIVKTVGYLVAVCALFCAASIYGGTKVSWRVFAISIGGALVFWILFVEILGIPLPGGILSSFL